MHRTVLGACAPGKASPDETGYAALACSESAATVGSNHPQRAAQLTQKEHPVAHAHHVETLATLAWLSTEVADVVEPLLLARPALAGSLAQNPHISETTWYRLWPAKPRPPVTVCSALAGRELDSARRRYVIEHDTRVQTLKALIEANRLEPDEQRQLLASKGAGGQIAGLLCKQDWLDPTLAKQVAEAAGGWVYLEWLSKSTPDQISDEEAAAFLANYRTWEPEKVSYKERSSGLKRLLARRPTLMAAAAVADQHDAVLTAAAGSRHLTRLEWQLAVAGITPGDSPRPPEWLGERKFTMLALVNNPVCLAEVLAEVERQLVGGDYHMLDVVRSIRFRASMSRHTVTQPYNEISDPEILKWLVHRAQPFQDGETGKVRPGQPYDLPVLAANPHLAPEHVEGIRSGLSAWVAIDALGAEGVEAARATLASCHPGLFAGPIEQAPPEERAAVSEHREEDLEAKLARAATAAKVRCNDGRWGWGRPAHWIDYVEHHLGASHEAWDSFLGLVDTFEGTFAELVEIVLALTPA